MISTLKKLSADERKQLEQGVVQVSGNAMNRTALGIVHAFHRLYPQCTFEELKSMLPDSLNPAAPVFYKSLFKPHTERPYGVIQQGSIRNECRAAGLDIRASHFIDPDETFYTADCIEVLISRTWESSDTETGQNDLQMLINHVQQYGIRVVEFRKNKPFSAGGFQLEIINPSLANKLALKKAGFSKYLVGGLMLILLLAIFAFMLLKKK